MKTSETHGWDYIFTFPAAAYMAALRKQIIKKYQEVYNYPLPFFSILGETTSLHEMKSDAIAFLPRSFTKDQQLAYVLCEVNRTSGEYFYENYTPQFQPQELPEIRFSIEENHLYAHLRISEKEEEESIKILYLNRYHNYEDWQLGGIQLQESGQLCVFYQDGKAKVLPPLPSTKLVFEDYTLLVRRQMIVDWPKYLLTAIEDISFKEYNGSLYLEYYDEEKIPGSFLVSSNFWNSSRSRYDAYFECGFTRKKINKRTSSLEKKINYHAKQKNRLYLPTDFVMYDQLLHSSGDYYKCYFIYHSIKWNIH